MKINTKTIKNILSKNYNHFFGLLYVFQLNGGNTTLLNLVYLKNYMQQLKQKLTNADIRYFLTVYAGYNEYYIQKLYSLINY